MPTTATANKIYRNVILDFNDLFIKNRSNITLSPQLYFYYDFIIILGDNVEKLIRNVETFIMVCEFVFAVCYHICNRISWGNFCARSFLIFAYSPRSFS